MYYVQALQIKDSENRFSLREIVESEYRRPSVFTKRFWSSIKSAKMSHRSLRWGNANNYFILRRTDYFGVEGVTEQERRMEK